MTQLLFDLHYRSEITRPVAFGGNAGRAELLLRREILRPLQLCRERLGFHVVRCRNMLGGDFAAVRSGEFDFHSLDKALDVLMENSLVPFFTLAGMPAGLARDGGSGFGPPADWGRWYELIQSVAGRIESRYSAEAGGWFFEVDAGGWTGTREEYYKLYDLAARGMKEVRPDFQVGGPGAEVEGGLDSFLAHVADTSPDYPVGGRRCDFVSLPAAGDPVEPLAEARRQVTSSLGADVPVICNGWGLEDVDTDAAAAAAHACRALAGMADTVQGSLFSDVSDLCADSGFRHEPFHGGRGLLTVNGVVKAAFNAFRLFDEHRGYHCQRLSPTWADPIPGLGCYATVEEYTLRLLAWYLPESADPPATGPVSFTIEGLPASVHMGQVEVIRAGVGSAFEAWVEAGRPQVVDRSVLGDLEEASRPLVVEVDFREYPPRLEPGMVLQFTIPLPFEETWND